MNIISQQFIEAFAFLDGLFRMFSFSYISSSSKNELFTLDMQKNYISFDGNKSTILGFMDTFKSGAFLYIQLFEDIFEKLTCFGWMDIEWR